jgi:beta-galactosidase GanA
MKKYVNGQYIEMTVEEIAAMQAEAERAEREYWQTVPYDEAVNAKIRERYTESQEFAILRQSNAKPAEYAEYYAYCEECKAFVKGKKNIE